MILPDKSIVMRAFRASPKYMEFRNDESHNWGRFGADFIFHVEDKETISEFVRGIKFAKVEQERKMRQDLDLRIMSLKGSEREYQVFGKALIDRVRFYIKAYYGKLDRQGQKH